MMSFFFFFFFQAEAGIRDLTVTGVQTCALPISSGYRPYAEQAIYGDPEVGRVFFHESPASSGASSPSFGLRERWASRSPISEIGRASWRERVEISVVAGSLKKKKTNNMAQRTIR